LIAEDRSARLFLADVAHLLPYLELRNLKKNANATLGFFEVPNFFPVSIRLYLSNIDAEVP
jgi:hypothetical protein